MRLRAAVLGSPQPQALGAFYARLLGWPIATSDPTWVRLEAPDGGTCLSFQLEQDYVRPVWPSSPGRQQMMVHLDIAVEDMPAAVEWARAAGATLAEFQPQDDVRVMLDPDGHPFCLFTH
jgi:catechol 2,3-dioxygenase-like lactoylglutathione lyase family enzyme